MRRARRGPGQRLDRDDVGDAVRAQHEPAAGAARRDAGIERAAARLAQEAGDHVTQRPRDRRRRLRVLGDPGVVGRQGPRRAAYQQVGAAVAGVDDRDVVRGGGHRRQGRGRAAGAGHFGRQPAHGGVGRSGGLEQRRPGRLGVRRPGRLPGLPGGRQGRDRRRARLLPGRFAADAVGDGQQQGAPVVTGQDGPGVLVRASGRAPS